MSTKHAPAEAPPPLSPLPVERARSGLLFVDKPTGVTSHDVVDHVRRRLGVRTAGHLGTLDPGASGLLVVATGAATRCAPVWGKGEKTYEGAAVFGITTTTQDLGGEVLVRRAVDLDERRLREARQSMVGEIEQVPPMVSAIKVGGERLYRLARRGVEVERAPRRVLVTEWEWLAFDLPAATFRVRCSAGTYVRTLVHDLGERLGCGGALQSLRRLRSEPFGLERSVTREDLDRLPPDEIWARGGIELEQALEGVPRLRLDADAARVLGFGGRPRVSRSVEVPVSAGPRSVLFLGPDGACLALGELVPEAAGTDGLIACPHVVFPWAVSGGRA